MSSGCVPEKSDRVKAIENATKSLNKAIAILEGITTVNIDKKSRNIEDALDHIEDALGQRSGDFIDTTQNIGLTDLVEHYFS